MGLPKIRNGHKYTAMLLTFGPYRPDDPQAARVHIKGMVQRSVRHLNDDQLIIAFETGDGGYNHCHIAMGLSKESKAPMKLLKACKDLAQEDEQGRKPNGSIHYVPIDPRHQRLCSHRGRFGVLRKYLTDPHKTKATDDGALEFVHTMEDDMKILEGRLDQTMYLSKEYHAIYKEITLLRLKQQVFAARERDRLWRQKHGIPEPEEDFLSTI